ncbi:MAG: hypothetical protein Q7J09_05725 [Methanocalculus sp.]|uniref:hypothetical protein n=1 Tax=Methanocalculus sp. TaxID=2004547 RepID=UPI0027214CBC|nr:hypothetical protein [Methanocalculus sp.]MDO8841653.1 hypothetical protein [Methanocalculus sp.]MDO9539485.1 hypothetical protein [Methanocalculus sp.]
MERLPLILIIVLLFITIGAENVTAAEYPTAPLGTLDSMSQFVEWLCELAEELIKIFTDAMEMIGLSNESYVSDMVDTMNDGMNLVNKTKGL